ncbi:MAG: glycosyltransferase family 4 protein [Candidatus Anstonellales archaeon]
MRIAMLGWEFPPFISGGMGVHCFYLTSALSLLGVYIDFFMPSFGEKITREANPKLRLFEVSDSLFSPYLQLQKNVSLYGDNIISSLSQYTANAVSLVKKLHKQNPYNIIHAHDWLCFPAGKVLRQELGIPLVQTFHSTEFDRTSFTWDFILSTEKEAVQTADRIITVSHLMKKRLITNFSADPGKIRVIYNAVAHEEFEHQMNTPSKPLPPVMRNRKKVLFLGRLTSQKGPTFFLEAAKKVLTLEPNTLFIIAGTGDLLPHLINYSISLGISQNVLFLGYISEEERRRIYSECDVYVLPSVSEPFGISALEAMASGTPTIISKNAGVCETIKYVLKVDFWDKDKMAEQIVALLRYKPLAKTLSAFSSYEARKFSWESAAKQTLNVYNELIQKHHS